MSFKVDRVGGHIAKTYATTIKFKTAIRKSNKLCGGTIVMFHFHKIDKFVVNTCI
jgi:hypothetical protein